MSLPDPPVLAITDRRMADRSLSEVIDALLEGGCRWILLREKDLATEALLPLVQDAARCCAQFGALLSVSGDLAAARRAGGVHLPQRMADKAVLARARAQLGPHALIGVSAHSRDEAEAAQRFSADYITLSPVFLTESKPGYGPALGLAGFSALASGLSIPVVALGGVSAAQAGGLRQAGAAGIAVMGAVMRARDPARAIAELIAAWRA